MLSSLDTSLARGMILSTCKAAGSRPGSVTGAWCVQFQSVRHYPRKPRWVPMAQSKLFKIVELPEPPKLERQENMAHYDMHRLYNRSLWDFQAKISREQQGEAKQVSEEVELDRIFSMTDAGNAKVWKIREAVVVEEWEALEQEILEAKKQKGEEELKRLEVTEMKLQSEMERLQGTINYEDLEGAIDKALSSEYDYNYGMTSDGKFLRGRPNISDGVDGPPPTGPIVTPADASK